MLAAVAALALAPQATAAEVLRHVRAAVGYSVAARAVTPIEATGKSHQSGLDGDFRFVFSPNGSYLMANGGELADTKAWNGKVAWERDPSGAVQRLELSDLEYQHCISWVLGHEWLDPQGPFDVTLVGTEKGGDSYTLNLKQKDGLQEQTLTVDKKTWRPTGTRFSIGELAFSMSFSDWRDFGGYKLPRRIDTQEGELKGWYTIEKAARMPRSAPDPYKRPAWTVLSDTVYDRAKQGAVESKRAFTGHILVHPTVQGKDVGWFILDSGAGGMAVDPEVAESLGAKRFGEVNVGGVGGVEESGFYRLKEFRLGPATVKELNFISVSLGQFGSFFGVKLAGIVGYDFFRRATVEVDVADGRTAVFSPHLYANEGAQWQRLVLDGRHPTAIAEFEGGHTGRFRLDTGADGTVAFNTPTVDQYKMLEGREVSDFSMAGVGGMVQVKSGPLEYFTLGGHKFEKITAVFSTVKQGILADKFLSGNIGQELLRPFRLVLDYPNQRLAMVLRPAPGTGVSARWPARSSAAW